MPSHHRPFLWGAATSAYQIEGGIHEDQRGASIWDRYSALPGNIIDGSSGERACDHYYRYAEDIALMHAIGIDCYRFSIAWPRVYPMGSGPLNVRGLDFYDRLTDALLAAHIRPCATLFHWDLPDALQTHGGWTNRQTIDAFGDYVEQVARRLGDRITLWVTLNEPRAHAFDGHWEGVHAPGVRDKRTAFQVAHHLLVAHGVAVERLRGASSAPQIGIALDQFPVDPVDASHEALQAAQLADGIHNRWFLDALTYGSYPEDVWSRLEGHAPTILADDMARIRAPIDFVGVNYYTRKLVRGHDGVLPLSATTVLPSDTSFTGLGWEVYPEGLARLLTRLHSDYHVPSIVITENGASYDDTLTSDGHVHDDARRDFLQRHIATLMHARAQGVPVDGYFAWSLLDNFEWGMGYTQRFGLAYVDFATLQRTLKDSGRWYRDYIAQTRTHLSS